VLLDHQIPKDPYGYAGISSEEGREHYSRVAIAGIWRLLTSDDGARKVLDAEALRRALRERTALETEMTRLRAQIDRAHEELRAAPLSAVKRTKDFGLAVDLLGRQAQLSWTQDAERRVADRLSDLNAQIERLKHNPAYRIALSDDAPAEAMNVTAEMIELEETGIRSNRGRPVRRLRDWLTPKEFADWYGVGEATVRRWLRGAGVRSGDVSAPWEPDDVPVIDISARRRVILVDKIKPTCVTDVARLDALEERLGTWPGGMAYDDRGASRGPATGRSRRGSQCSVSAPRKLPVPPPASNSRVPYFDDVRRADARRCVRSGRRVEPVAAAIVRTRSAACGLEMLIGASMRLGVKAISVSLAR